MSAFRPASGPTCAPTSTAPARTAVVGRVIDAFLRATVPPSPRGDAVAELRARLAIEPPRLGPAQDAGRAGRRRRGCDACRARGGPGEAREGERHDQRLEGDLLGARLVALPVLETIAFLLKTNVSAFEAFRATASGGDGLPARPLHIFSLKKGQWPPGSCPRADGAHRLREEYHAVFGGDGLPVPVMRSRKTCSVSRSRRMTLNWSAGCSSRPSAPDRPQQRRERRAEAIHARARVWPLGLPVPWGTHRPVLCRAEEVGMDPGGGSSARQISSPRT